MRILGADLAFGLDASRPVDDERVADAAAVCLALPAAKRRVARERPAPGVVVEGRRPAELVYLPQVLLQRVRHVVEELVLVHRTGRAAFRARAVIRDEHDERIFPLADGLQ